MKPTTDPSAPELQGTIDAVVVLAPIVPEKAEAWRRLMQELAGARRHEHEAARRRLGIRAERAWISETRQWTLGLILIEADGARQVSATLATSSHAFDCWFREQLQALQGLDLAGPSRGAAPELLFAWRDDREIGRCIMSTDAYKHHIHRWFDALNEGTALDVIDETYAPDYVLYDPTLPEPVRGVEGIRHFIAALLAGFPDAHYTVEDLIAEGDKVVQRCSVRGTHRGPFLGVPATGKAVAVPFIIISRFDGDKIAEEWQMLHALGLLQQLGVIPAPAPVAG